MFIKKLLTLIVVCTIYFSTAVQANDDEFRIQTCYNCNESQMKSIASAVSEPNGLTYIHVVDPFNNIVKAFNVIKISETEFQSTQVYLTDSQQYVIDAVDAAAQLLSPHPTMPNQNSMSEADKKVAKRIREAYPGLIPNHIKIFHVAPEVMSSADEMQAEGNKVVLSEKASKDINLPIEKRLIDVILGKILPQFKSLAIAMFADQTFAVLTLVDIGGTLRWKLVAYVDSDGVLRDADGKPYIDQTAGNSSSGGQSDGVGNGPAGGWVFSGFGVGGGCYGVCEIPSTTTSIRDLKTK